MDPTGAVSSLEGKSFGADNPIAGAKITLYASGTAFGSATAIANYPSSKSDGSFTFSYDTMSPNNNTTSSFNCSANNVTSNSILYLVSSGGNTANSGGTNGNLAAVMVAPVGLCQQTGSVTINEATTVATVWAMQQFMNVTSTGVFIGAPSTLVTGETNALVTANELVNMQKGTINTTGAPAGSVAGVTMSSTIESAKLVTLSDILANCVNQAIYDSSNASNPCTILLSNSVSPIYQTNAQPVISTTTPQAAVNTAMAAYFLAINPTQAQDSATNGATRMTNLYNIAGYTPYGTGGLTAAPSDWTISVAYNAGSTTCSGANSAHPFTNPKQVAIDASGNLWVANGAASSDAVAEMSLTGQLLNCIDGTIAFGNSVNIDIKGNVWYTAEGTSATSGNALWVYSATNGTKSWSAPTGYEPYLVTSNKAGDVIITGFVSGTYIPQIYSNAANSPTAPFSPVAGSASGAAGRPIFLGMTYYPNDSTPYIMAPGSSSLYTFGLSGNAAPYTASNPQYMYNTAYSGAEKFAYRVASDNNRLIAGASQANTSNGATPYSTWFQATPGSTSFVQSAQFLGGLNASGGVAVDALNNYWSAMNQTVISTTTSGTTTNTYAFGEVSGNLVSGALSEALSPPASASFLASPSCTTSSCTTGGGFQALTLSTTSTTSGGFNDTAIDESGNVWGTLYTGSASATNGLVKLVGAAAPVITPLVNQIP